MTLVILQTWGHNLTTTPTTHVSVDLELFRCILNAADFYLPTHWHVVHVISATFSRAELLLWDEGEQSRTSVYSKTADSKENAENSQKKELPAATHDVRPIQQFTSKIPDSNYYAGSFQCLE